MLKQKVEIYFAKFKTTHARSQEVSAYRIDKTMYNLWYEHKGVSSGTKLRGRESGRRGAARGGAANRARPRLARVERSRDYSSIGAERTSRLAE